MKAGTQSPAENRRWHPAGTDRAAAERLAELAAAEAGRIGRGALADLRCLPPPMVAGQEAAAATTYRGYERNV